MTAPLQPPIPPVAAAVAAARGSLAEAVTGRLWHLTDTETLAVLEQSYAAVAQAQAAWLRIVAEADRRNLAAREGATGTAAVLRGRLRMRPEDATGAVRLARQLDTSCPAVAEALGAGEVSLEQARVITKSVDALPEDAGPSVAAAAEAHLLEQAREFDPKALAVLGKRIHEVVDPDAADEKLAKDLDNEERQAQRRRELRLRDLGDGSTSVSGRLDAEAAGVVRAALDPLAAPLPTTAEGRDQRTPAQRAADALVELCRRQLEGGEMPDNGGDRPQVNITIDWDKLRERIGAAALDTGTVLSPEVARKLACDAKIIPAVLDSKGQVLDVGRARRLFTGPLRRAIVLRDKGCAFPGCDRPPAWCSVHHCRHWVDGGDTCLDNGLLLCGHHHALIHRGDWEVFIDPTDRLPTFRPPTWIDPERKPLRNTLHRRP